MSDPVKVADAILCAREYPVGPMDRDFARNSLFGPVLGSERVHSRFVAIMPAGRSLVTRISETEVDNTEFHYAKNDVRHPAMCHDWFVATKTDTAPGFIPDRPAKPADFAGDTVLIGFKKADSDAN